MANIQKYNIAKKIDSTLIVGNYIFIATTLAGVVKIYKNKVMTPNINIVESPEIDVDKINEIIGTTNIYCAVDSDAYICCLLDVSLSSVYYIDNPVGIIESSIGLTSDATYVYLLTPGIESGINAKIIKYTKTIINNLPTLIYVETIDLTNVFNAKKIDIDYYGVLWVVTNSNPVELVKVWYNVTWQYSIQTLS